MFETIELFSSLKNNLKALIAWVLFILVFPILMTFFTPFILFRSIVFILWKIFGKFYGLRYEMNGLETGMFTDSLYTNPRHGISNIYKIKGKLNVDELKEKISKILNHSCLTDMRYERLNSIYPSIWLQYAFWTQVSYFNLSSHFRILQKTELGSEEMNEIFENWIHSPFEEKKPLWDILIIPGLTFQLNF